MNWGPSCCYTVILAFLYRMFLSSVCGLTDLLGRMFCALAFWNRWGHYGIENINEVFLHFFFFLVLPCRSFTPSLFGFGSFIEFFLIFITSYCLVLVFLPVYLSFFYCWILFLIFSQKLYSLITPSTIDKVIWIQNVYQNSKAVATPQFILLVDAHLIESPSPSHVLNYSFLICQTDLCS